MFSEAISAASEAISTHPHSLEAISMPSACTYILNHAWTAEMDCESAPIKISRIEIEARQRLMISFDTLRSSPASRSGVL